MDSQYIFPIDFSYRVFIPTGFSIIHMALHMVFTLRIILFKTAITKGQIGCEEIAAIHISRQQYMISYYIIWKSDNLGKSG